MLFSLVVVLNSGVSFASACSEAEVFDPFVSVTEFTVLVFVMFGSVSTPGDIFSPEPVESRLTGDVSETVVVVVDLEESVTSGDSVILSDFTSDTALVELDCTAVLFNSGRA